MIRRVVMLGALAVLVGVSGSLSSQSVADVIFLPQTYYVGDLVEARVVVRSSEDLDLSVPQTLPSTEWVDLREVSIVQRADGYEVRILFQPFFVGTRQLPAIDLGSFTVSGVSAVVSTLQSEEGELELQPVRDQLLLPGTRALIAAIILAVFGIPLVVVFTGGWITRHVAAFRERYRANRPYRTLQKRLKQLQTEMHELDGKGYYIRLVDITRSYLEGRYGIVFRSATTGELDRYLRKEGIPEEQRQRLIELFQFGDLVKFANRRVTVHDRTYHLEAVKSLSGELQRAEWEGQVDVGT
ncbi:MAG: hypothetical protein ACOCU4_05370 [Alkalispirochaeta sp.]